MTSPRYARTIPLPRGAVLGRDDIMAVAEAIMGCFESAPTLRWDLEGRFDTIRGFTLDNLDQALADRSFEPHALSAAFDGVETSAKPATISFNVASRPHVGLASQDQQWVRRSSAVISEELQRRFPVRRGLQVLRIAGIVLAILVSAGMGMYSLLELAFIVVRDRPWSPVPLMAAVVGGLLVLIALWLMHDLFESDAARIQLVRATPWYDREFTKGALAASGLLAILITLWQILTPMLAR